MKFSTEMQIKTTKKENIADKKRSSVFSKLLSFKAPKLREGFTLIEIMVAVSIFSLVMLVAIGSVLSIVSANRKAQALNTVINNLNFALEGMVRDLRTGYDYDCHEASGINDITQKDCYDLGGNGITFHSSQYEGEVTYRLNGSGIEKTVDGSPLTMTGQEVEIKSLRFYVNKTAKSSDGDYFQPKIIITLNGAFNGFGTPTNFNLQTMVTQRKLDI